MTRVLSETALTHRLVRSGSTISFQASESVTYTAQPGQPGPDGAIQSVRLSCVTSSNGATSVSSCLIHVRHAEGVFAAVRQVIEESQFTQSRDSAVKPTSRELFNPD